MIPEEQDYWIAKRLNELSNLFDSTERLFPHTFYQAMTGDYPLSKLVDDVWKSLQGDDLSYEATTRIINDLEVIQLLAKRKEYYELCQIIEDIKKEIGIE